MKNYFTLAILVLLLSANLVSAQQANLSNSTTPIPLGEPPVDGFLKKEDLQDRKVMEYARVRPDDVAYVHRIWQEFDLRDRSNAIYASPRANLMQIIMDAVLAGELTAYDPTPSAEDPTGDSFKTILPADQVLGRFGGDSTLVEQYDEEGNVVSSRFEAASFNPEDIIRFRIKEDWIFDKNRSVFEVRIVGIAPLVTPKTDQLSGGSDFGDEYGNLPEGIGLSAPAMDIDAYPAFWIYFPEARHILVSKDAPSRQNDASGLSYDDVFTRRLFTSYVVKEERADGLRIKDYISEGIDRLYESERIKKALVDFEQKRWSY